LWAASAPWVDSVLSSRCDILVYELDVVPWVDVDPGDVVDLDITHPVMWTRATGAPGYTGPARVIGVQRALTTGLVTLTVALSGAWETHVLAPSAPVMAWTGLPANPATIDVPDEYYDLFVAFLASASPMTVGAYMPGADVAAGQGYTISAVGAPAAGVITLTVAALIGAPVLTTDWFITIPTRALSSTAQARHLHTDTPDATWR